MQFLKPQQCWLTVTTLSSLLVTQNSHFLKDEKVEGESEGVHFCLLDHTPWHLLAGPHQEARHWGWAMREALGDTEYSTPFSDSKSASFCKHHNFRNNPVFLSKYKASGKSFFS